MVWVPDMGTEYSSDWQIEYWVEQGGQENSWITSHNKQRVLTPGHQGWNDLHSLCRNGMEYYLLNDNNNNDNNNNNNDDDNENDDDNNNNDNNNDNNDDNNNNDDASGCFFTNVTFTAVAEISIRWFFFSKAIKNLTCFSFISFYSELTSLYISTPYTYQVWI